MDNAVAAQVSGAAYKLVRLRAYHHATMLLSSDLEKLRQSLRSEGVGPCALSPFSSYKLWAAIVAVFDSFNHRPKVHTVCL